MSSEKSSRLITKIKAKRADNEEILIGYDVFCDRAKDGFFSSIFKCKEEPASQFYDKLDAFLPYLMEFMGLNADIWKKGAICGVNFKYLGEDDDDDNQMIMTISGKCEIHSSYDCLTCTSFPITPKMQNLVNDLTKEAIAYLDGARRQQALQFSIPEIRKLEVV